MTNPQDPIARLLEVDVERIARAVMQWGQPHFKHMVAFSTLCEALAAALSVPNHSSVGREAVARAAAAQDSEIGDDGWDVMPDTPRPTIPRAWSKSYWLGIADAILALLPSVPAGVSEALEPFANAARRIDYFDGESYDAPLYALRSGGPLRELLNGVDGDPLTVGHLRSAARALASPPPEAAGVSADGLKRAEQFLRQHIPSDAPFWSDSPIIQMERTNTLNWMVEFAALDSTSPDTPEIEGRGAQWQSIETAPKDGQVLGWMPNSVEGGRPYVAVIWWDDQFRTDGWDDERDEVAYVGGWSAGRVGSFSYEEYAQEHPTHWMPLPVTPNAIPNPVLGDEK